MSMAPSAKSHLNKYGVTEGLGSWGARVFSPQAPLCPWAEVMEAVQDAPGDALELQLEQPHHTKPWGAQGTCPGVSRHGLALVAPFWGARVKKLPGELRCAPCHSHGVEMLCGIRGVHRAAGTTLKETEMGTPLLHVGLFQLTTDGCDKIPVLLLISKGKEANVLSCSDTRCVLVLLRVANLSRSKHYK